MRIFPRIARYLQFRLAPDPVENDTDQIADTGDHYSGIFIVDESGLAPFARHYGGGATDVPAAFVEPPHSPSVSGKAI